MKLESIISMANDKVRLPFLAMERSLRATGCKLPILVIPYDDHLFDLPKGSSWWSLPEIIDWLNSEKAHPVMRKYQSLIVGNYQFVDADVCFLRNPEEVLAPYSGFITSCGHWRDPRGTCTVDSQRWMSTRTTLWQRDVFNTGQFACDRPLYDLESLKAKAMDPEFINTCIKWPHNEQPGLDWLVLASNIQITNLTLPPLRMESTWAGDYPEEYEYYWQEAKRKPYLIHWAGTQIDISINRPIDSIFYSFLTKSEREEWQNEAKIKKAKFKKSSNNYLKSCLQALKRLAKPVRTTKFKA